MELEFISRFATLDKSEDDDNPTINQKRGYAFEKLMLDLFEFEQVLLKASYWTGDNRREQIDGAIEVWNRVLLVEVKWVEGNLAASDLYSFIGKVENKLHGTLGLFVSRRPLSDNFIKSLNIGRRQSVIVVHGKDIDELFSPGSPSIVSYIEYCLKQISFDNVTHVPFRDFAEAHAFTKQQILLQEAEIQKFIDECLNNPDLFAGDDMPDRYRKLNPKGKKEVYRYVLDHVVQLNMMRSYENTVKLGHKYKKYLDLLTNDSPEIEGTIALFFREKMVDHFHIYGQLFGRLYYPDYRKLDDVTRSVFEAKVVEELRNAEKFNDFNSRRNATEVVQELWDVFKMETRKELTTLYIHIYMDTFLHDDSVPKRFARKLVDDRIISQEELQEWFVKKLTEYFGPKREIDEGLIDFFIFSYEQLFPALGLEGEAIKDYVTKMAYKVQAEQKKKNS